MKKILIYDEMENILYIKGSFFNSVWFSEFGQVQSKLLSAHDEGIKIDMRDCCFVSPTPFLSLLLTLKKVKEEKNCKLEIILPDDDTIENKKFLNYCSREGFLDVINDLSDIKYEVSKIKAYNVIGNENFENIYKAHVIELERGSHKVKELVDEIIDEINESKININKEQKLYVFIAIRNILQELIDNVDKHAYVEGKKYFSLYIRIRYSTESTLRIGKNNNTYGGLLTTTKPDEVYVHKGIELYFQDIGKGIIKSYEEKGIVYPNRPLREIIRDTFFKEKFENRDNNTPVNGLAFLRKIIEEKNNFFCVFNEEEGVGNFGINDSKIGVNNVHMMDISGRGNVFGIRGQIYNFTLFDRAYSKLEKKPQENLEGLLNVFSNPFENIRIDVIDLREDSGKCVLNSLKREVILFVPRFLTKNLIINTLKNVFENSKGIRRLIIADIEDEETILFEFALKNLFASSIDEKNFLLELYIVTKSLKVICFKPKTIGFKLIKSNISFVDFNNKYKYLYKLKIYESKQLAQFLENNLIGKFILTKGKIEWTNNENLNGFINFDMMSANDYCFDLLQRNLKRVLPIIGNKQLYAIDSVVERIVEAVNVINDDAVIERFGVGSVIVSGLTLQSSDYEGNTIHFFSRGNRVRRPALFFDPIYLYKNDGEGKEYIRTGKTSRIRLKNSTEQIRRTNSYLEEKEMYKILHQYAYSSVLCGHLCFEKRHDLLSINLNALMYDKNTQLQSFIEKTVEYGLGHYYNEILEENSFFDVLKDSCLIVYPYNQFTSAIFKMCKKTKKYKEYIVGLSPTNITHQGENLEYAECYTEYIKEVIDKFKIKNKFKPIKIIIFDTLIYSGKTKQEIYEYINSIEESIPYYISVIDAKVNHYTKQANDLNYMNLNIPLIGKSETCKICLALNKLSILKDSVIDANILSSIENITKVWKVKDIRNHTDIIKLSNFSRIYANNIISYDTKVDHEEEDLYFVNALPLYIFITNRIKLKNDYTSIEFVLDNYRSMIDKDSMAYICSLFLLEYGESVYHSLLIKVMKNLLIYLKDSTEFCVRQFVVLALLSISDQKLINTVFEFINEDGESMQTRLEGQIVLMYCLNKEQMEKDNIKIMFLYNKMKSGNNRLDLYKQFHCQIKNTNGDIHNSPLYSLIHGQANINNTRLALASLSLLEESLKCAELSFDILYEEGRDNKENNRNEEISILRENCLENIKKVKLRINTTNDFEYIEDKLNQIYNASLEMHKRLFAPLYIKNAPNNIKTIQTQLAERVDIYNDKIKDEKNIFPIIFDESYDSKINVSDNIVVIYYIWNNMLVREIDYILDNVGKFVSESQTVYIEQQRVSGQIKINITSSEFIINIFNNTKESIENIRKTAKQRYQKEVLSLLGVKFEYFINNRVNELFDQQAVITKITIPNIQNIKEK